MLPARIGGLHGPVIRAGPHQSDDNSQVAHCIAGERAFLSTQIFLYLYSLTVPLAVDEIRLLSR